MQGPNPLERVPAGRLRVLQIVAGALIAGVLILVGVVLVLVQQGQARPQPGGLVITYMALALVALQVYLWAFVPGRVADRSGAAIAAGTWTPGQGHPR